ncbi:lysosomal proton-coupled steroid conjugate and bile acid symporter SLC46A3-like [Haliotis cracherodii]|uniref:lysosomal proton-coupled steroid conjugate and bile acid symporter SLC46A3-like n=1 Tax=Haliotis cracherodii TaxID=6455 RepID=UPI0039EC36C2
MATDSNNEKSPLLSSQPDTDEISPPSICGEKRGRRSCLFNLVLANVVVCILTSASSLFSPALSQYVYHRISLQVFGNDTRTKNFSTLAPCFQNTSDPGYILQERAQIESSEKLSEFTIASSGIAVLCNVILGTYSDFFGRKFLYVICMTGYVLRTIVTVIIIHWNLDLDYLFLATGLYGLCGGSWSFTLASCAYTADNTPPHQSRSLWMAVIETVTGLSAALTSLAVGYFIQATGYFYPSLTSALVNVLGILVVILFMEETCPRQQRSCITPLQGLRNMMSVYVFQGTRLKKGLIWLGLLIFLFSIINNSSGSNLDTLFEMNLPFCWSPEKMGLFNTITYLVKNLVGVFLVKGLQYCMTDEVVALVATVSAIGGDLMWGFATNDFMLYAGVPVVGLVGFAATPIIRGIMSKMAPQSKQGALFASLALVESACSTFGTPLFNSIYQETVTYWRGAVFIAMGAMHAAALVLYLIFVPLFRKEQRQRQEVRQIQTPKS